MAEKMGRPRGRPPGAKNRRTEEREAATAEAAAQIEQALGDAFQGDAHALLMAVYKNPANEMPLRVDAAKAAIRYEKPALSSIDAKVDANVKATIRKVQRTVVDPRDQNPAGVPAPPEAG